MRRNILQGCLVIPKRISWPCNPS